MIQILHAISFEQKELNKNKFRALFSQTNFHCENKDKANDQNEREFRSVNRFETFEFAAYVKEEKNF